MMRTLFFLALILTTSLACSLTNLTSGNPDDNPTPIDTTNWVAFVGRNVEMAAPPEGWILIPFNLTVALEQQADLEETYPTVANVYRDLVLRFTSKDDTRLVLLKRDGTAWAVVRRESMAGTDTNTLVTALKQAQRAEGANPYDEEMITIHGQDTQRWKIARSPTGSQVVNREWHHAVPNGDDLFYVVFSAQGPDFSGYEHVFDEMVRTLQIMSQ
jgi:hypothetical protein